MTSSLDLPRHSAEELARPSFELLYSVARSYLPDALRLFRVPPEDVDDIVHDAVLVAHRGLDRYTPRAGPHGEPPDSRRSLKAWLSAIAWRLAARRRGRAYRRLELPLGNAADLDASLDDAPTTEQLAAATQRTRILAGVLDKLRPERAEVLLMHTFLEMSVPDIAAELGLNPNTVKSRIGRARSDAIAAVKRLSRDEQSVLEGNPLLLPFALDTKARSGEIPRTPTPPVRLGEPPRPAALLLGAAGVLAVGMALGAGLTRPSRHAAADAPRIGASREAALTDTAGTTAETLGPVADMSVPTVMFEAPSASPQPGASATPRGAAPTVESRALARELVWITAAKRALYEGSGERALAALRAHEAEFPRGVLAPDRDLLRERARAAAAP